MSDFRGLWLFDVALVAVFNLFGGVPNSAAHEARFDQALPQGNKNTRQSEAISFRAQGEGQKEVLESASSKPSKPVPQSRSVGTREPPFLKHFFLFGPNSVELGVANKNKLKRAAAWLHEHPEARILIVGYCDSLGSEMCTHSLAETRGVVVREFLMRFGIESDQIAGVKGWENVDRACQTAIVKCQQLNRSAQIFIASSAVPLR